MRNGWSWVLLLAGQVVLAAAAEPAKGPPGTATAVSLANTALRGMISNLESGGAGLRGTPEALACARKIPVSKLSPLFLDAINKEFDESERRQLDAFSSSSAAAKARRLSEIEADRDRGPAMTGETPRLTTDEARQLSEFDDSALSRRLFTLSRSSPALRTQVNLRLTELVLACGFH